MLEPLGYVEFLSLVADSAGVLTDSGGIQEETTYLGVPCFTLRDNTERPVTVEMGTNVLLGLEPERIAEVPALLVEAREREAQVPPLWDGHAARADRRRPRALVGQRARRAVGRRRVTLPGLRRQYVKLCDLRDFDDPAVQERIDDIVPGLDPTQRVQRKNWEYALLTLFLEDAGLLGEETRILSVGAGHETVLFWLANRVDKVVATDIYGEGLFSGLEADRSMLNDPASFSPYPYRESHLEVRHMDAKQLEFDEGSFDAVFSLSSIEHFGSWADIRRSAEEMGRVLRPGGVAFVVTECFLGRSLLARARCRNWAARSPGRSGSSRRRSSAPRSSSPAGSSSCNRSRPDLPTPEAT